MQGERFEWDDAKAEANYAKHGVKFEVAQDVFDDPLSITIFDPDHSCEEDRFIIIGSTLFEEILIVLHTFRGSRIRIINARRATHDERNDYMNKKDFTTIHDADLEMRPEYDFSKGVRGKYAPGRTVIHMRIDSDVARYFSTSTEVNDALRQLIAEGRAPQPRDE